MQAYPYTTNWALNHIYVKHGDISTTAMDISFSILFEFYFIFSLYFEALLYYLYRSFHAYVIRASKRQRHCWVYFIQYTHQQLCSSAAWLCLFLVCQFTALHRLWALVLRQQGNCVIFASSAYISRSSHSFSTLLHSSERPLLALSNKPLIIRFGRELAELQPHLSPTLFPL